MRQPREEGGQPSTVFGVVPFFEQKEPISKMNPLDGVFVFEGEG